MSCITGKNKKKPAYGNAGLDCPGKLEGLDSMCGWGRLEYTGEAEMSLNKTGKSSMLHEVLQRSNALYLKVKPIFTPRYGLRKDVLMLHG